MRNYTIIKLLILFTASIVLFACVSKKSPNWQKTASIETKNNPITRQTGLVIKAFPGAMGYGAYSRGGRGGKVVYVENLNDRGIGSLRWAIETLEYPRTIIFRTGGIVQLSKNIIIKHPFVTIAGQTAPGDGICLKGAGIVIKTHDVIIRHIRIRRGDDVGEKGRLSDGIAFDRAQHSIVDHISVSWAFDESMQVWYPDTKYNTIQNSIFSEPLNSKALRPDQGHAHGYGPLFGNGALKISFIGNLVTNSRRRNPRLSNVRDIDIIENLFYDFAMGTHIIDQRFRSSSKRIKIIGNIYKNDNFKRVIVIDKSIDPTTILINKNVGLLKRGYIADWFPVDDHFKKNIEFNLTKKDKLHNNVMNVWNNILSNTGALMPSKDSIDSIIIQGLVDGKGSFIDCVAHSLLPNKLIKKDQCRTQSLIGKWPTYKEGLPYKDQDRDGMSDLWEKDHNLNELDPKDANNDIFKQGYTNLEYFLNELAGDYELSKPKPVEL